MIKDKKIAVIGLGYVGLPLAVAFSEKFKVIGLDLNSNRISQLKEGFDQTKEIESKNLRASKLEYTDQSNRIKDCNVYIVTVPTPVDHANQPDLSALRSATKTIGGLLKINDHVIYESTVYPGVTEEVCVPILEKESGLVWKESFSVGYSPERINPGDREHTFKKITKVVSGDSDASLDLTAKLYGEVIDADVYRAESIKVAEASKAIENAQRDLNIAFMNELAMIFDRMGIDTKMVLEAAGTKWNFLNFKPGLVGGHCIGVDPYYLTHKALELGYHSEVILAGRRINDQMGSFVASATLKELMNRYQAVGKETRVSVLGLTFKQDCPDIRNSKVVGLVKELQSYGLEVQISDPYANPEEVMESFGLKLTPMNQLLPADGIVLAVNHKEYVQLNREGLSAYLKNQSGVLIDVKSVIEPKQADSAISLWRL